MQVVKRKARKIDPQYALTGAARVAREFYKDPQCQRQEGDDVEVDLLEIYGSTGRLWSDCPYGEGQVLLTRMLRLAVGMHNITEQTAEAVKVLEKMLAFDRADHLQARQVLLRCFMDTAQAEKAREVVERALHGPPPSITAGGAGGAAAAAGGRGGWSGQEEAVSTEVTPYALSKKRKKNGGLGGGEKGSFYRGSSAQGANSYMAQDPLAQGGSSSSSSGSGGGGGGTDGPPAACFYYAAALIEHISLRVLQEPDATLAVTQGAPWCLHTMCCALLAVRCLLCPLACVVPLLSVHHTLTPAPCPILLLQLPCRRRSMLTPMRCFCWLTTACSTAQRRTAAIQARRLCWSIRSTSRRTIQTWWVGCRGRGRGRGRGGAAAMAQRMTLCPCPATPVSWWAV